MIDVKRKLPAGLTGKPEVAEPRELRTHPCQYETDAVALADRILTARSEAYVKRWCERPDVDAIDGDIIRLHLIRPDDKSAPFHSLEDIALRHSVTKQAIAKRRKRIVTDLLDKGSKRGSDNLTPQEPVASGCRFLRAIVYVLRREETVRLKQAARGCRFMVTRVLVSRGKNNPQST